MRDVPRLHVITPPTVGGSVADQVARVLAGGAPLLQVRTKGPDDRSRHEHTCVLARLCRDAGARVLVNDRVDLALAVGADGVHVGADDLPVPVARRLLGPDAIVGATARGPDGARRAVDSGATYLGVGPVYATATKDGLPDPMGPAGLEAVAAAVDVPVIAIAGVTAARVPELLDAGAWGVAVVGAVFGAPDPAAATTELLELLP
ncbi:MAG TPA: thiamine phosphate synthase [Acidimicrobiales bacterium]|nr:thiamine phosphate synthase [Acidimicrobiales bacterium]